MQKWVLAVGYIALVFWRFPWDQAALLVVLLLCIGAMNQEVQKVAQGLQKLGVDGVAKELRRRVDGRGRLH